DFGVARQYALSLERNGSWAGTASYMSPERIANENQSYGLDIWALGLSLYEMVTGVFGYAHVNKLGDFFSLVSGIVDGPPPRLPDTVDEDVRSFVHSCLDKDP
ncbi:hypothetical protein KIPB_014766, partial [Kipferlia bialata]